MIGSLRGVLINRELDATIIVEVGGVGYKLHLTPNSSTILGEIGSQVFLYIHTRVREDSITLYGFLSNEEKSCFEALIGTHGVGPSMALALLSMHSPTALRQIVAHEDSQALSRVPGIGKKTAARLLIELKAKFDVDSNVVDVTVAKDMTSPQASARADVTVALSELGYAGEEIRRVMATLPADASAQELLRLALRALAVAS